MLIGEQTGFRRGVAPTRGAVACSLNVREAPALLSAPWNPRPHEPALTRSARELHCGSSDGKRTDSVAPHSDCSHYRIFERHLPCSTRSRLARCPSEEKAP